MKWFKRSEAKDKKPLTLPGKVMQYFKDKDAVVKTLNPTDRSVLEEELKPYDSAIKSCTRVYAVSLGIEGVLIGLAIAAPQDTVALVGAIGGIEIKKTTNTKDLEKNLGEAYTLLDYYRNGRKHNHTTVTEQDYFGAQK